MTLHVKPRSSRPGVGGVHGDALIVSVRERAVDGKATRAALRALANELGCRERDMRLVTGATSRVKVVEVADEHGPTLLRLSGQGIPA